MVKKIISIKFLEKITFITLGAFLAAFSIEVFFLPNQIIDGGIVGISMILHAISRLPLAIFTFFFNIIFLVFGYNQIGRNFAITSIFSISMFSFFLSVLSFMPLVTDDVLLASVFGGIVLGLGVGLILRYGGYVDGTEVVAMILNEKTIFSVGQILMIFNLFILSGAAWIYGWDRAFYSILAFFVVQKTIDVVLDGLEQEKSAMIISDEAEEIASAIECRLGRMVTYIQSHVGEVKDKKTLLYVTVTRIEMPKLLHIVHEKDLDAFVAVSDVADVMDGKYKKKSIH
jgi:uncharacterized membrane-anchored protein YitT (DUF2179 family)